MLKNSLPHGEFESWCEANCRWKAAQRQRIMQLAKEHGSKPYSSRLLDINTEVTLLKLFADEQEREAMSERVWGENGIQMPFWTSTHPP